MKEEKEYIKDLSDIREMMERSSRFLSLSGLAGVLSGIYAIAGAFISYSVFGFNPDSIDYIPSGADNHDTGVVNVVLVGVVRPVVRPSVPAVPDKFNVLSAFDEIVEVP